MEIIVIKTAWREAVKHRHVTRGFPLLSLKWHLLKRRARKNFRSASEAGFMRYHISLTVELWHRVLQCLWLGWRCRKWDQRNKVLTVMVIILTLIVHKTVTGHINTITVDKPHRKRGNVSFLPLSVCMCLAKGTSCFILFPAWFYCSPHGSTHRGCMLPFTSVLVWARIFHSMNRAKKTVGLSLLMFLLRKIGVDCSTVQW